MQGFAIGAVADDFGLFGGELLKTLADLVFLQARVESEK